MTRARFVICFGLSALSGHARAQSVDQLRGLSIEQLGQIEFTSVTKTPERLSVTPSAIYVITREAILNSGYASVPEILRLAPNLFVAKVSPSRYIITARGLSGSDAAQNFTNKLLVLIDGRSVYTPIFSGVYWDQQDVLVEDIDRIEVISGTGSTLWGANAVNGVINIITRSASATQGLAAQASEGTTERSASVRYGGKAGDALSYRLYVQGFDASQSRSTLGQRAGDGFARVQGGFRVDWDQAGDKVTLQGDAYSGANDQGGAPDEAISGRNINLRWSHTVPSGDRFEVQGYYDHTHRGTTPTGLSSTVDTYDLSLQHSFAIGQFHALVVGGGIRAIDYSTEAKSNFYFMPSHRTETIGNIFLQDSITLSNKLKVVVGLKLEDNYFSGIDLLPSARLAFTPNEHALLWAAISRAIRSPTPFDHDVFEVALPIVLSGNKNFLPERVVIYEGGARFGIGDKASVSISGFYNNYDKLRNVEVTPVTLFPIFRGNGLKADTYGVDLWASVALAPWWRMSAYLAWLEVNGRFRPGASTLLGVAQLGDDPEFRAGLSSDMDLGRAVHAAASLRYVDKLPDPRIPSYVELDARLAWRVAGGLEIALVGRNLLHKNHLEYAPPANPVQRSVLAQLPWRY